MSITSITDEYGREVTIPDSPTKEGYAFGGWYQDLEFYDPFTSESSLSSNIALYAKWVLS